MIAKITAVRRTPKPSSYKPGTFWNLTEIKIDGQGDTIFELVGFGKEADKLVQGSTLKGYFSQKTWNNIVTRTFNKITAEYVYDLLVAAVPGVEGIAATPAPTDAPADAGFGSPVASQETPGF